VAKKETEYACCCDGMEEAISMGGIQLMESEDGPVPIIPDEKHETGMIANFCPFCGEQLVSFDEPETGGG
jgi:hypothetical protein